MAGNMKTVKLRIKSIQNTMQITKAMELVASSKLGKAKERAEVIRPYFQGLHGTLMDIAEGNRDFSSVYVRTRKDREKEARQNPQQWLKRSEETSCYILIAGDRGLAGGYNTNLFKVLEADLAGKDASLVSGEEKALEGKQKNQMTRLFLPIGKKAIEYCERKRLQCVSKDYGEVADISLETCYEIGNLLCTEYKKHSFDCLKICYTDFFSMLSQRPEVMSILPLSGRFRERKAVNLILYEPNSEEVFDAIVPEYVAGVIYGTVCESLASELAARRMAMESATKNAKEMIEKLSLSYNRARQAGITQELTEIVAGGES